MIKKSRKKEQDICQLKEEDRQPFCVPVVILPKNIRLTLKRDVHLIIARNSGKSVHISKLSFRMALFKHKGVHITIYVTLQYIMQLII